MDDGIPTFGVGFEIGAEDSFSTLANLRADMSATEAEVIGGASRMEQASRRMVDAAPATAQMKSFGHAATRTGQTFRAEQRANERSIDGLVKLMDRQTAALGRTKEEQRALRIEQLAADATRLGNTDAVNRLLASETANLERRGRVATYQAEQERDARAAVNAQLLEQSRLEQALERGTGLGRMSAAQGGATFSALAERERALELAEKTTAEERRLNQVLAERARISSTLERTTGAGAAPATDRGATFSALAAQAAMEEAAAAAAAERLTREHAELAATVRASAAAMEADAASAERLRASTDPLYVSTSRLNAEIAESTRLYHAGVTGQAEYGRQQEVLGARLRGLTQAQDQMNNVARRGAGTLTQLSFQINDVATMAAMGAPPFQIFASQAGQIFQVAQMAEGGLKGFSGQIAGVTMRFLPLIGVAAVAGAAFMRWHDQVNDAANMDGFVQTLGLTKKELKELGDQSVTSGDMVMGFFQALNELPAEGTIMSRLFTEQDKTTLTGIMDFTLEVVKGIAGATYGLLVGSYRGAIVIWEQFPAAIGDIFVTGVNGAIGTIEGLTNAAIDGLNELARRAEQLTGIDLFDEVGRVSIDRLKNEYAGAADGFGDALYEAFDGAAREGLQLIDRVVERTGVNATARAQNRARDKANEIMADRTQPRGSGLGERLAREAEATEAQIRNLYRLADAYRVSGAEALVAEARVKAESQAIKQRGDIEAAVERQIRLAIAQRVSDAAKSTAGVREQIEAQRSVNAMVEAGIVPAERAAEVVKDQIDDLPLLAALQVAQQRGLATEVRAATIALDEQRRMRVTLRDEERRAAFNTAFQAGEDRLSDLRAEIGLIGAAEPIRVRQLATIKATREAERLTADPAARQRYIDQQVSFAELQAEQRAAQEDFNQELTYTADLFDTIDQAAVDAARGMADAFGPVGGAIGEALTVLTGYHAAEERLQLQRAQRIRDAGESEGAIMRANRLYAIQSASLQVGAFGDMASAAKGFFKEGSSGWQALAAAEKAARAIEFALSVRAIAQDAIETGSKIASSGARAAAKGVEAVVNAIASLPFPLNIAAGAATAAVVGSLGVSLVGSFSGGGRRASEPANEGRGTILGDPEGQSASIRRSIDQLREVDTLTLSVSREMLTSLRSIDSQIGSVAALVVRAGNVNASAGVREGFQSDTTGKLLEGILTGGGVLSKIPVIGGLIGGIGSLVGSLFGSTTKVVGSGLYGGTQSVGSIVNGGFDASYYSDVERTKRFLGVKTGTSTSTRLTGADADLERQFGLIIRSFSETIASAAGPLGQTASEVEARVNAMTITLGKIDLKGLTGEQIEEKLSAVFGAAADRMAAGAFPGLERFQKVGEGAFETLVRVASTVEAVTATLEQLGGAAANLSLDAKIGLADQFDSVGDFASAADAYFERFFSAEEQAAARMARMDSVFASLGTSTPATLSAFRTLVDAQDLATTSGRATYATLLQLAPAFADLKEALEGAKSAADIAAERADLERKLLEVRGDTAALRALDLARLDASNRALQEQIWAIQDAQEAARAADELRKAWGDVGKGIEDEIKRIRGLSDATGAGSFASLMGQFNAQSALARGGDQDAAKTLPTLSQALLKAAEDSATSRQELDRVRAQTASSLEATLAAVARYAATATPAGSAEKLLAAAATAPGSANTPAAANDALAAEVVKLREEVAAMRKDNNAGHAAVAANTGSTDRRLAAVTDAAGGEAIAVANAA